MFAKALELRSMPVVAADNNARLHFFRTVAGATVPSAQQGERRLAKCSGMAVLEPWNARLIDVAD